MNLKKYYRTLLTADSTLTTLLGSTDKIVSAYPQEVKTFPLVVYEDMNSRDVAFSDNLPEGTSAQVRVHVFSKTVKGYAKAEEIADVIRSIFRADYWTMTNNQETADVNDNIKHRVLDFTREFYSL